MKNGLIAAFCTGPLLLIYLVSHAHTGLIFLACKFYVHHIIYNDTHTHTYILYKNNTKLIACRAITHTLMLTFNASKITELIIKNKLHALLINESRYVIDT
jgi:hypothetical protein